MAILEHSPAVHGVGSPTSDSGAAETADRESALPPADGAVAARWRVLRTKATLVALDLMSATAGVAAISALRAPGARGVTAAMLLLAAFALWFSRARLYSARFITRRSDEVRRIVNAGLLAMATVAGFAYTIELAVDRAWLAAAAGSATLALVVQRELHRRHFDARRRSGHLARRVLLVGGDGAGEAAELVAMFEEEPELGYVVVARLNGETADAAGLSAEVLDAAERHHASGVVIASTEVDARSSNRLIRDVLEAGMHVELSSTLADIAVRRLTVRPLGKFPVVYIEPRRRAGWRAVAKRSFDLAVAMGACTVLAPVVATIALAVRLDSPGPVLFRQTRVGKDGRHFKVLKFRTMVVDAEARLAALQAHNEGAGPLFKMKNDPRVTRVGALLRKTSLDEIPQLWNVVRNEMSLIGPRPALPSEMAGWDSELFGRLRVRPGITGMWQVSGRSGTTFLEYTRLDLYYVDNWSLVVDLSILAKTIPAVLRSEGAY